MADQHAVRRLERDIDEILFWVWDPIGVNDSFCARSEYGTYAWQVVKILLEDAPDKKKVSRIVRYLDVLSETPEKSQTVAERCLDAFQAWRDGLR